MQSNKWTLLLLILTPPALADDAIWIDRVTITYALTPAFVPGAPQSDLTTVLYVAEPITNEGLATLLESYGKRTVSKPAAWLTYQLDAAAKGIRSQKVELQAVIDGTGVSEEWSATPKDLSPLITGYEASYPVSFWNADKRVPGRETAWVRVKIEPVRVEVLKVVPSVPVEGKP